MARMITALTCALAQWSPGLGDNNVMGWLTVIVYLLAALASARLLPVLGGAEPTIRRERLFWTISAAIMLCLAVNKQLDLQSLVTMLGRCHAQLSGWFDMRRTVQELFVLTMAGVGIVGLGLFVWFLRGVLGRVWLALLGIGFVCGFVVVRAASFHHVDALLGTWMLGLKLNWLLELPGPTLVGLVGLRRRHALLAG
jgi:hypothetical protein